jgi:hypothetical protein
MLSQNPPKGVASRRRACNSAALLDILEFSRGDYTAQWGRNIKRVLILVYLRPRLDATSAVSNPWHS